MKVTAKLREVGKLTIADLNLTAQSRNDLMGLVNKYEPRAKKAREGATKIRIIDVIMAIDALPRRSSEYPFHAIRLGRTALHTLHKKLRERGLTEKDWTWLAIDWKTEAEETLSQLRKNKKRMKELSVMYLTSLSPLALALLSCHFQKSTDMITIGNLLHTAPSNWHSYRAQLDFERKCAQAGQIHNPDFDVSSLRRQISYKSHADASIKSTRQKLKSLGFTAKDGYFLHENTREWHIERIMKSARVKRPTSTRFLNFALTEGPFVIRE